MPDPITFKPDPNVAHLPEHPQEHDVQGGGQLNAPHERTNLRELPYWFSQVWNLLDQEGRMEDDEEVVFINSFYISHATNLVQDRGRPLRFDRNIITWVEDISFVWEDLFDRQAPFSATIVTPEPPFILMPGCVATMLIVQHPNPMRTACLTTAIDPVLPRARMLQIALSPDIVIPYRHILHHGRVSDKCDERAQQGLGRCSIHIGHLELPYGQPIRLHEGLGLTIRLPPPVPPEEWERQFVEHVRREHPPQRQWDWGEGDEANFMARRPRPIAPRSTTSSSSSTDSSSTRSRSCADEHETNDPMQEVILLLRDGRSATTRIPRQDQARAGQHFAEIFGLEVSDIVQAHRLGFPTSSPDCRCFGSYILKHIARRRQSVVISTSTTLRLNV